MKEIRDMVRGWREAPAGARMALTTVVQVQGSTYRKPGARMLWIEGITMGSISGGCLEADLVASIWSETEEGPCLATYDTTTDDDVLWGYGLGCRGVVTVILERIGPADPTLSLLEFGLNSRQPITIRKVISPGRNFGRLLIEGSSPSPGKGVIETTFGVEVFIQTVAPPEELRIYGAGFDAVPLARIATELGWRVRVFDHRSQGSSRHGLPDNVELVEGPYENADYSDDPFSAAVVMTHNFDQDRRVLERLLASNFSYAGVLGPRARTVRLLDSLHAPDQLDRLNSPIGLDIGSETPEEIALAIVAEIQAVRKHALAGFMKTRATQRAMAI